MIKNSKSKLRKIRFNNLFYNNKFIMFFSLICSFTIWFFISSSDTDGYSSTVTDIPVEISLSESAIEDGLKIFSGNDITAKVEVKGSRMSIGQIKQGDIQVLANQSREIIRSPGSYTLGLTAKKIGLTGNYMVSSEVKPSFITVLVDRYREAEFNIEPEVNFTAKDGYFIGNIAISNPKIKISGPETEVSKIKKVVVRSDLGSNITNSVELTLPVILLDAYNQSINSEMIKVDFPEVNVDIPILVKKEVPINPSFTNLPKDINIFKDYKNIVKINPKKLEIAGSENIISEIQSLNIKDIDFRTFNLKNHKVNAEIIFNQGVRSLSDIKNAEVSIDMSMFKEKTITVNEFSFVGLPENKSAKIYNSKLNVNFVGLAKSINALKPSNIIAQVDLSGKEDNANVVDVPVNLIVKDFNDVWSSGKYFVNVSINENIKN